MNTEIGLLKIAVQNTADKGIFFGAPIGADLVRGWESQYNVKLPEDYFAFLTEVGDGGAIVPITPDCNTLVSFQTYEQAGYSFSGIGKPFTLEKSWMPDWGDTIKDAPDDEDKLEKLMNKRWNMIRYDGNITLMEDKTDNFQRWFLVVTGPCRGEVWMESEFGVLRFPDCTFSKWLRLLLEDKWEAYAAERAKEEQKERERHTTPRERCLELLKKGKYRLKPVATMDEVRAFEAQHGIILPEDYIEFVTTVANGSRPTRTSPIHTCIFGQSNATGLRRNIEAAFAGLFPHCSQAYPYRHGRRICLAAVCCRVPYLVQAARTAVCCRRDPSNKSLVQSRTAALLR